MKLLARIIIPLLLLLGAFYAGVTVGHHQHGFSEHKNSQAHREARRKKRFERLSKKLHLTEEQQVKLKRIFDERRSKLDNLKANVRPEFKSIREESRESILAMLDTEQKALFEKHRAKMKKRWAKRRKGKKGFRGWLYQDEATTTKSPDPEKAEKP